MGDAERACTRWERERVEMERENLRESRWWQRYPVRVERERERVERKKENLREIDSRW